MAKPGFFDYGGMRGTRTFSSGATVECDRNCFRAASPITLKKLLNVASAGTKYRSRLYVLLIDVNVLTKN